MIRPLVSDATLVGVRVGLAFAVCVIPALCMGAFATAFRMGAPARRTLGVRTRTATAIAAALVPSVALHDFLERHCLLCGEGRFDSRGLRVCQPLLLGVDFLHLLAAGVSVPRFGWLPAADSFHVLVQALDAVVHRFRLGLKFREDRSRCLRLFVGERELFLEEPRVLARISVAVLARAPVMAVFFAFVVAVAIAMVVGFGVVVGVAFGVAVGVAFGVAVAVGLGLCTTLAGGGAVASCGREPEPEAEGKQAGGADL